MLACGTVSPNQSAELPSAVQPTALPTDVPTPSPVPTPEPTPDPTPEPTPEPTPTPYDPYTLSDEEAIEMGSYIYDNYIARYKEMDETIFNLHPYQYEKKDIINLVCLLNQKIPVVYDDRYACEDGYYIWLHEFYEYVLQATSVINMKERKIERFPYSLFLKEGRPERELLEELEKGFDYISNNDVSNEEIYEWWGKAFKLAMNSDETFKDWNTFDLPLFFYYVKARYTEIRICREKFNGIDLAIPAKYVFDNNKNQRLETNDAFFYDSEVTRNKYNFLTDEEYDSYIRCVEKVFVAYLIEYEPDYVPEYAK